MLRIPFGDGQQANDFTYVYILGMKNEGRMDFILYGLYFHAQNVQAACIKSPKVL